MENNNKYITGRLGYNSENGRYGLLVSDLWEYEGFRCGENLQVMVEDKWYLVGTPYKGKLEYVRARIKR